MPARSPQERALIARIAARHRWAHEADRKAATAPARAGQRAKFEAEIRAVHANIAPDELARRVDHLVQEHMLRMSLAAARARSKRRSGRDGGA